MLSANDERIVSAYGHPLSRQEALRLLRAAQAAACACAGVPQVRRLVCLVDVSDVTVAHRFPAAGWTDPSAQFEYEIISEVLHAQIHASWHSRHTTQCPVDAMHSMPASALATVVLFPAVMDISCCMHAQDFAEAAFPEDLTPDVKFAAEKDAFASAGEPSPANLVRRFVFEARCRLFIQECLILP